MSDRIRVVSANLWNGGVDPDGLADLLRADEVDVACFQELSPEQAEAIASVLPYGRLEPSRENKGMGIALRHPPAELDRVPLPRRDAHVVRLRCGEWPGLGGDLEIIGVHVQSPVIFPYWRQHLWRRGQTRGLERYLAEAPRQARILAGDLNATPLWPVYRRLVRQLEDVAVTVARRRGVRPARTWGPGPAWPRLLRIDHILAQHLESEDSRVVPLPGGDHSAVVADVLVPADPA